MILRLLVHNLGMTEQNNYDLLYIINSFDLLKISKKQLETVLDNMSFFQIKCMISVFYGKVFYI